MMIFSTTPIALAQTSGDDGPCCCSEFTGNIAGDIEGAIDITDLTFLIDHLFITFPPLSCTGEANVDANIENTIDIADLTFLVDHLFITYPALPNCTPIPKPVHQLGGDGEIICDIDFGPPCASQYILPYRSGNTYKVI